MKQPLPCACVDDRHESCRSLISRKADLSGISSEQVVYKYSSASVCYFIHLAGDSFIKVQSAARLRLFLYMPLLLHYTFLLYSTSIRDDRHGFPWRMSILRACALYSLGVRLCFLDRFVRPKDSWNALLI